MNTRSALEHRYSRDDLEKIIGKAQELYGKDQNKIDRETLSATAAELDIPKEYIDRAIAELKKEELIREKSKKIGRSVLIAAAGAAALVAVIIAVSLIRSTPAHRLESIRDAYYNDIVARDEKVKAAQAQLENVIRRRFELIPALTNLVREYAAFEKDVIASLDAARRSYASAGGIDDKAKALAGFNEALMRYTRAAGRIPALASSRLYENLMVEIAGSDNRISVERKRYNEAVNEYNVFVRRRPLADYIEALGFEKEKKYWETTPSQ